MRILELVYGFQIGNRGGGITRFGIELSRALRQRGFDIHLCGLFNFGTSEEGELLARLNSEGINSFYASVWNGRRPYYSFWKAVQYLWRWQSIYKSRIIHSHSEFTDILAIILKFHPTQPAIIRTVHYGFRYEWRKRPWRRLLLTNLLYPLLFDVEIGVSRAITNRLDNRPLAKILGRRAFCIYNAINLARFHETKVDRAIKRESLGIPSNVPLVGTVGRLTEQKGFSFFIGAVPWVLEEIPDAYFLIVGDGELSESLKRQALSLGVAHRVIFTGQRSDVEEILGCLDLFVSSSLWEGLPTVILESMATSVPVIATDIPGTREIVQDRYNGWLVLPGDSLALAKAIIEALKDARLREEFANRAQQVVSSFSLESVVDEYEWVLSSFCTLDSKSRQFSDR